MAGWIVGGINAAITDFFKKLVTTALNPLLELLGKTLLSTPTLDQLPRIGELWTNSWQIMLACYGILVLIAGVLVMAYESVQTRYSVKEIAPRIVVGFLARALSLFIATQAIAAADALSRAVLGPGVDVNSAATTLRALILGSINDGIFVIFMGIFIAGTLVALLVTYAVRVALTVILVAGAPLALMCHALPQTEGIARWWWRCFGGLLAIQLAQSLTLVTAMRIFLAPGGFTLLGPTKTGLVNLIVSLALIYILFKIPFWILGSVRGNHRRSLAGSLARAYIATKTFGAVRAMSKASTAGAPARSRTGTPTTSASSRTAGGTSSHAVRNPRSPAGARRRAAGPAVFRAPVATPAPPPSPAPNGPPGLPTFRAPHDSDDDHGRQPTPSSRPAAPPGPPTFLQPDGTTPPPTRPSGARPTAGPPRFQQPTTPRAPRPHRARSAPVTFRPPTPPPSNTPPPRTTPPPRGGSRDRRGGSEG